MSNSLLTTTAVTRESLRVLHQKLNFVGTVTRDYDDSFARDGAKIGDTLKIRLPNQYTVRTGSTMDVQDTAESSTDLTVATIKGVDMQFSDKDLALSLDDFSKRIVDPAMSVLAAHIEADALSMYKDVYQQISNTGAAITTEKLGLSRKALVDALAPNNDRTLLLNTQDNVDAVEAMKGLFHKGSTIEEQFREGMVGKTQAYGDVYENTHLTPHTRGAADTAYTTDTRTSALATDGTAYSQITVASGSGAGKKGDIFTIGNVFRVHPETKVSTAVAQQFVVTEDFASGATTIKLSPSIVVGGAKQNVTIPTTSATAAISWAGTASTAHGISLAYQKGAFAFATADLPVPKGTDMAAREVFDGISMRLVRDFDIINGRFLARIDVLYGYKAIRPQLAVRLANR
jgi:hypothetical protein